MSIPSKPATVGSVSSDLRQFVDKLDKSGATSQIHAEKNNEGKVIFFRAVANNKNAGTVVEHLKLTAQRQVARDEIKRMLQDSGITLTEEIKKAMPSLKRGGDANTLHIVLKEAVSKQDAAAAKLYQDNFNEIKDGFIKELETINFEQNKIGIFLRANSDTAKAIAKMLYAEFTPISNLSAKVTAEATLKSLSENKDPDLAMTTGYQALLSNLSSVILPDSFKAMSLNLAKEIDNSAAKAIQNKPDRAAEIKSGANTLKKIIVATLLLRVFTTQVTVTLDTNQKDVKDKAQDLGVNLKSTTKLIRLTTPLLSLINDPTDTAKVSGDHVALYEDHPKFKNFVSNKSLNNLDNFTAYHDLIAQIQATNSLSDT